MAKDRPALALALALALAAALAAPPAGAQNLGVDVSSENAGSPDAPQATTLSVDFYPGTGPLGTLTLGFPPEVRLGGAPGAATCALEQVVSAAETCPRDSRVVQGTLSVTLPE